MEAKGVVACTMVGILGLISTIVGLVLELLPDKKMIHLFYWSDETYCTENFCADTCVYFRSPVFFLVVGAIICVFVAQIITSIATDCGCCRGDSSSRGLQTLSILGFFFSWVATSGAIILFLLGGAKQYGVKFGSDNNLSADGHICYKVKHGIFGGAAASSFVAVTLGIVCYLSVSAGARRTRRRYQAWNNSTDVHNNYSRDDS